MYAKIDTNNDFLPNFKILLNEIFKPIPAIAITSNTFDAFWKKTMNICGMKLNDVRTDKTINPIIK